MTEFSQRSFQTGDFERMVPGAGQLVEYDAAVRSKWGIDRPPGLVWSFLEGDAVIAIGGLFRPFDRPHVVEAWSIVGRPSRSAFARLLCRARDEIRACDAIRVEAMARTDLRGAGRVLERLGFTVEGVHPFGGPGGTTVASYAILREGPANARLNL